LSPPSQVNVRQPSKPRSVSSVRRWSLLTCLVPFGYAVLGVAALAAPNYEVFPFFSWFLFPVTPTTVTRFAVRIQHGDQPPNRTAWFEEDTALGVSRHSMDAQMLIQTLGNSVESKHTTAIHQTRSTFERNFLTGPCRYRLVKRSYDPLIRWTERTQSIDIVIATFECGRP
jgi:hypothetical protein